MKKKITALFIIFIFSVFLIACNNLTEAERHDEYDDQISMRYNSDVSETTSDKEFESNNIENINDKTLNDLPKGGGDYVFSRKYLDEVYNTYLTSQIVGEEVAAQWDIEFLEKPPEEQEGLPPIYQMIRDLNITREQFEAENEKYIGFGNYFSQDIIDALYCGNEEEMKILLANPYALVYDGEIYTFNELSNTPATCSAQSIPADVMEEYLDYIESACNEAGILKYEQERIDNLREYCETGE